MPVDFRVQSVEGHEGHEGSGVLRSGWAGVLKRPAASSVNVSDYVRGQKRETREVFV